MAIRNSNVVQLLKKPSSFVQLERQFDLKNNCYMYKKQELIEGSLGMPFIKIDYRLKYTEFQQGLFIKDKEKMTLRNMFDVINSFLLDNLDKIHLFNIKDTGDIVILYYNEYEEDFFQKLLNYVNKEIAEKAVFKHNFISEQNASRNLSIFFTGKEVSDFKNLNPEIFTSFKRILESNAFYKRSSNKFENIGIKTKTEAVYKTHTDILSIKERVKEIKQQNDIVLNKFKLDEMDEIDCYNILKANLTSKHMLFNTLMPLSKNLRIRKQVRSLMALSKNLKRQQLSYDIDYYGTSFKGSSVLLSESDPLFSTYYPNFLSKETKENLKTKETGNTTEQTEKRKIKKQKKKKMMIKKTNKKYKNKKKIQFILKRR